MEKLLEQINEELKNDRTLLTKELIELFNYLDTETIASVLDNLDSYLQYRVNKNIEPKED